MKFLDKLRNQKLLSTTLVVFTLSIGILIGTLDQHRRAGGERAGHDQRCHSTGDPEPRAGLDGLLTACQAACAIRRKRHLDLRAREEQRTRTRRRTPSPNPPEEDEDQGG